MRQHRRKVGRRGRPRCGSPNGSRRTDRICVLGRLPDARARAPRPTTRCRKPGCSTTRCRRLHDRQRRRLADDAGRTGLHRHAQHTSSPVARARPAPGCPSRWSARRERQIPEQEQSARRLYRASHCSSFWRPWTPAERLAFVRHDMFAVTFNEIAPIVERTPDSHPTAREPGTAAGPGLDDGFPDADLPTQRRVVDAFLAAARAGDFAALIRVLDPDVVFRVDTGGRSSLAPALLTGAVEVADHAATQGPRFASLCESCAGQRRRRHRGPRPPWQRGRRGRDHRDRRTDRRDRPDPRPGQDRLGARLRPIQWTPPGRPRTAARLASCAACRPGPVGPAGARIRRPS